VDGVKLLSGPKINTASSQQSAVMLQHGIGAVQSSPSFWHEAILPENDTSEAATDPLQ